MLHTFFLGENYLSYKYAPDELGLECLEARWTKLCIKFHFKLFSLATSKICKLVQTNDKCSNKRLDRAKYCDVSARHTRFQNRPISFLTRLLKSHLQEVTMFNSTMKN